MSTFSQFVGGGARIKSIQRGIITGNGSSTTVTATITAVNTAKAELRYMGLNASGTVSSTHFGRVSLTNSTTITANFGSLNAGTIGWELTEWE